MAARPTGYNSEQRLVSSLFDMTPEATSLKHFFLPALRSPRVANKPGWLAASDLIHQASVQHLLMTSISFTRVFVTPVPCIHLANGQWIRSPPSRWMGLWIALWLMVGKRTLQEWQTLMPRLAILQKSCCSAGCDPSAPCLPQVGGSWTASRASSARQPRSPACRSQLSVLTDACAWLYRHAEAVLFFPSLAEGFSLPRLRPWLVHAGCSFSDLEVHRSWSGFR